MNNKEIGALWLQVHSSKFVDMSDLLLAQHIRKTYENKDQNFRLSPGSLMKVVGANKSNIKRRLARFVACGMLTRTQPPQGSTKQYQPYVYRLSFVR